MIEGTGTIGIDYSSDCEYPLFAQTEYEEGSDEGFGYTYVDDHFIKKVIIKEGITRINRNLFRDLHALTEIELPDSLEHIDEYAFAYCENLKSVFIPAKVAGLSSSAFYGCSSLEKFTVAEGNECYYSDEYGVVYQVYDDIMDYYEKSVCLFPEGGKMKSYTIAEDVTCFNTVRNMFGYTGTYQGKKVSVMGLNHTGT